jgi:hypothetical protein
VPVPAQRVSSCGRRSFEHVVYGHTDDVCSAISELSTRGWDTTYATRTAEAAWRLRLTPRG